jgi:RNAse (barnase) inhibitor barstar
VAFLLPAGVSALIDPDDEASVSFLELCAALRQRLGLPTYSRADLDRLFQVLDAPVPSRPLPPNVIPFRERHRRRRRGDATT